VSDVTQDQVHNLITEHGKACPVIQRVDSLERSRGEQYDRMRDIERGQTKVETQLGSITGDIGEVKDDLKGIRKALETKANDDHKGRINIYHLIIGGLVTLVMALLTVYVFVR
jgi:hypothetical protein